MATVFTKRTIALNAGFFQRTRLHLAGRRRQTYCRSSGSQQASLSWELLKTGLAPIESHFLSRFRGIRSVPVPFLEAPF